MRGGAEAPAGFVSDTRCAGARDTDQPQRRHPGTDSLSSTEFRVNQSTCLQTWRSQSQKLLRRHGSESGCDAELGPHVPSPGFRTNAQVGSALSVCLLRTCSISFRKRCFIPGTEQCVVVQKFRGSRLWLFSFRGKLNLNGNMELVHPIVEPISLRLDLKRALPPHRTDLHYDIYGKLHIVKVSVLFSRQICGSDLRNFV